MTPRFAIAALLLLLVPVMLFAVSTVKISGSVQDTETGEPLIGISILI